MSEQLDPRSGLRSQSAKKIGLFLTPIVAVAGVAIAKPFGFDPVGELRNQRQPDCVIIAPDHKVSLAIIVMGLGVRDGDLAMLSDTVQLKDSHNHTDTYSTDNIIDLHGSAFDFIQPGETLTVPHIGVEACAIVQSIVPDLPEVK